VPERCPCGGGKYAECCGPYHGGLEFPPTAEALMRSRYSAYVLQRMAYVRDTWHPSTCPADLAADPAGPRWLELQVVRHTPRDATHAEVEFVARYQLRGRERRMHEVSRFVRVDARGRPDAAGRWLYVDGDLEEG
jgi:SEC-C motif-containing protein